MAESLFVAGADEPAIENNDAPGWTLATGLVFSVPGTVTHIRYRFPISLSGTYIGVLYQVTSQAAGTELARATFSSTPSGAWATVELPGGGVAVAAGGGGSGTAYRAAIWTLDGKYTATGGYFTAAKTTGHITGFQDNTAPAAGGTLRNGAFLDSADGYPTGTFNAGCYFVDVVFEPAVAAWTYGFDIRVG